MTVQELYEQLRDMDMPTAEVRATLTHGEQGGNPVIDVWFKDTETVWIELSPTP